MLKYNYKLVEGLYDNVDGERPVHVLIIRHRLLVDTPRASGHGYEVADEQVVETFTRRNEAQAREDAARRTGELTLTAA